VEPFLDAQRKSEDFYNQYIDIEEIHEYSKYDKEGNREISKK
jgi:hypothetical protein